MALTPGSRFGPYDLVGAIGAGGMGEVYRARDTKLNRDVAIKVLPDLFATDPDRLARFTREAQTLAALNHPNIAHIYGVLDQPAALVMEFVDGEDLSTIIARGPLPIDDALAIARHIANALEAAHEHGIIHRDLKPANVKVKSDGTVKVLDFGLAKAINPISGTEAASVANSPTLTAKATAMGVIVGTAAYMAPEQARGKAVDRRADIWAFGVVLFEMLAGTRAFKGDEVSDTLASVLRDTPDFAALPPATPVALRRLLKRCLEKDPRRRLRDAGDVGVELDEIGSGSAGDAVTPAAPVARASRRRAVLVAVLALAVAAAAAAVAWQLKPATEVPLRRFTVQATSGAITDAAIAPDGRSVAFLADDKLWIRRFDAIEPRELTGITGVHTIFWSPDSTTLGFQSQGQLWKVAAAGGTPAPICRVGREFSASGGAQWLADDRIVFTTGGSGLMQVPALGGEPTTLLAPDLKVEVDFHHVSSLPGGNRFLFVPHPIDQSSERIDVFDGTSRRALVTSDEQLSYPVYSPSGHILYSAPSGVWAIQFSLDTNQATGAPFRIASRGTHPSVAADGTLSVLSDSLTTENLQLTWVDRAGAPVETIGRMGRVLQQPRTSPDGRFVAGAAQGDAPGRSDIWVVDLERRTERRLTYEQGVNVGARWSPDGKWIVYSCPSGVCSRSADGLGQPIVLQPKPASTPAISPDGTTLVFAKEVAITALDLFKAPLGARGLAEVPSGPPLPFVATERNQNMVEISPNGKYAAYASNETGLYVVYLTEFPSGQGKWQVSPGFMQRWNSTGDRLYLLVGDSLREVEINTTGSLSISEPRHLFSAQTSGMQLSGLGFQPSPDGSRFLVNRSSRPAAAATVTITQNWAAEFAGAKGNRR